MCIIESEKENLKPNLVIKWLVDDDGANVYVSLLSEVPVLTTNYRPLISQLMVKEDDFRGIHFKGFVEHS